MKYFVLVSRDPDRRRGRIMTDVNSNDILPVRIKQCGSIEASNSAKRSLSDTHGRRSSSLVGELDANGINVGRIIHSGWLAKQRPMWKSWKRRYFVLQTRVNIVTGDQYGVLQFFRSNKFGKLKGEVVLTDAPVSVRHVDIQKSKKPYCFEIIKGFYNLVCQCQTEQEAHTWVNHLNQVAQGYNTQSSMSSPSASPTNLDWTWSLTAPRKVTAQKNSSKIPATR